MTEQIDVTRGAQRIESDSDSAAFDWKDKTLPSEIKELRFPGEVTLHYTETNSEKKKLLFDGCEFNIINIKNEKTEKIREIVFRNCRMDELRIYHSDTNITLENSEAEALIIDYCDISKIKLEGSEVKSVSLENKSEIKELRITNESAVDKLDNKDAKIETLEIHSSQVEFVHIHNSIGSLELGEGARLERFSIDGLDKLKRFLNELRQRQKNVRGGTRSQMQVELRHQHQIVLAAFNQYADENRFQEMDMCLVRLRQLSCDLSRIGAKNRLKKAAYMIENLVLGKMFGWGVQIINSLVTSAVIIAVFAVIYFFALINSVNDVWQCIQMSAGASVNRFFGADPAEGSAILEHFDTIEQIIGVIILTIFTGVIARKIIK